MAVLVVLVVLAVMAVLVVLVVLAVMAVSGGYGSSGSPLSRSISRLSPNCFLHVSTQTCTQTCPRGRLGDALQSSARRCLHTDIFTLASPPNVFTRTSDICWRCGTFYRPAAEALANGIAA